MRFLTLLLSISLSFVSYPSPSLAAGRGGRRAYRSRDAYVVQSLVLDDYITVADGNNPGAALESLQNQRISMLTTELYLTQSKLGENPMGISLNLENENGILKISPAIQQFDSDADLEARLRPGAFGSVYRVVTSLGGLAVRNDAIYNDATSGGRTYARGMVPEFWVQQSRGPVADPYINDFIRKIFGHFVPGGSFDPYYPGMAGRIAWTYDSNIARFTADASRFRYDVNMRVVSPPSKGGGTILVNTQDSLDHWAAESERIQNEIRQDIQNRRELGSTSTDPPLTSPWDVSPFDDLENDPARQGLFGTSSEPECSPFGKRSLGRRQQQCAKPTAEDEERLKGPTCSIETRVGGELQTFTSIGGRVGGLAGAAGVAILPVFIILDLVEGDWKAAAWAVGATAAGLSTDLIAASVIGASIAASVVGILTGIATAALFMILPGLFSPKTPPPSNNATEIIQWTFFGDATHSGNEKCNQQLQANGQTPNCTVSYGAGVLSSRFDWDIYDAAVFLIATNEGHSTSIPDMAAKFQVYDYTQPASTENATFIIDCGKSMCYDYSGKAKRAQVAGDPLPPKTPCSVSKGYQCSKPIFKLNRSLITLPILNMKADAGYAQVNSGECKIVSDPVEGEILYPIMETGNYSSTSVSGNTSDLMDYFMSEGANLTNSSSPQYANDSFVPLGGSWSLLPGPVLNYTGRPVSIACNLTKNIPDVLSPIYNASASMGTGANESTNGDPNSFIPPPAPQPFQPLTPQNSICLSTKKIANTIICLPNGTFPTCQGGFGYKMDQTDTLSFPSKSGNLTVNIAQMLDSNGDDVTPQTEYDQSITADAGLKNTMSTATHQKDTFKITYPIGYPIPQTFCVYSQPSWTGDVYCMGVGGTNFTTNLVNKIQSFTLSPGLVGWLYPGFYGNPLGLKVSASVADISDLPYHTSQSFKGNLAAAWIYDVTANQTSSK